MINSHFYIGVDLGQSRDYSALAIVEQREERPFGYDWVRCARRDDGSSLDYRLRQVERIPLGTPYPRVIRRIHEVVHHPALAGHCTVALDATGGGLPVLDMAREADLGCDVIGVSITSGQQPHRDGAHWFVPKRDLILRLHLMLENQELRVAPGIRARSAFIEELMNIRSKRTHTGYTQYAAFDNGAHDDLALAVSLACWIARRPTAGEFDKRLCY